MKLSTLKSWRRRSGVVASASETSDPVVLSDLEQLDARAKRAWIVASQALEEASKAVKSGKAVSGRNHAVTLGVLCDKALLIERAVQEQRDREVRLAEGQGEYLAAVIRVVFEACGVPLTQPVRRALREALERAGRGDVLVVSPAVAQEAFADVRSAFERKLREEILAEFEEERRDRDVLTLPAPAEPEQRETLEILDAPDPASSEPIQDVDVVYDDDVPGHWREAYHGDEPLARSAWESHKQRQAAIARRDAAQGMVTYRPSTWKNVFDVDGPGSSMRHPPGGGV